LHARGGQSMAFLKTSISTAVKSLVDVSHLTSIE